MSILDNAYFQLRVSLAKLLEALEWIEAPDPIGPNGPAHRRVLLFLCVLALAALGVKLNLSLTTFGSSDIVYWTRFKDYINKNDSITIYKVFNGAILCVVFYLNCS